LLGTSNTYRLKARNRDQDFFERFIQSEKGLPTFLEDPNKLKFENDAQRQMFNNVRALLEEFEKKKYSQVQLKTLAGYIIQKCVIVMVASTDEDMAFRIFNVLNDRGKDLTISDILKSEVLEKVPTEELDDYTDKWEDVETMLGADHFKEFFSHLRAIYAKKKADKAVVNEIRSYVKPADAPRHFINSVLMPYSQAFNQILKNAFKSEKFAEPINLQFNRLKRVAHKDWIPCAINFISKYQNDSEKVRDFMLQLEKVTLGMEAMKTSLNARIERYANINQLIDDEKDLYNSESKLMLSETDRLNIINTLNRSDLYGKRLVKPVLAKIEEEMNDGSNNLNYDILNIEHILPQTATDKYWLTRFDLEKRIKWTNNLGNLSLVTVRKNSQAKNYDYAKKIEVYFKADGKASNLAMVNRLQNYKDWTEEFIQNRNQELLNHFLKAVGLEEVPIVKPVTN